MDGFDGSTGGNSRRAETEGQVRETAIVLVRRGGLPDRRNSPEIKAEADLTCRPSRTFSTGSRSAGHRR